MIRRAFYILSLIFSSTFAQIVKETTYEDFIDGTLENTVIITPDPDGVDNGAISFPNYIPTIKVLIVYPPTAYPSNLVWQLNLYERRGSPPIDIQCYGITILEFNLVTSVRERFNVISFEDGIRYLTSLEFFDGLIFGVADVYGHYDLSAPATGAIREFATLGNKVIIFTHSTIWNSDTDRHAYFNSLIDIHNINTAPQASYDTFNVVYKYTRTSHPVLERPFSLPDTMGISYTHRRGQIPFDNEIIYVGVGYHNYEGIYLSCHRNDITNTFGIFLNYGHQPEAPNEWDTKTTINSLFLTYRDSLLYGTYISNIIELNPVYGGRIFITRAFIDITGRGSAVMLVRSSSDGISFSDWIAIPTNTRISLPVDRYIQYQIFLSGMNLDPPVVHSVQFHYAEVLIEAELLSPSPNSISSCPSQDIRFRIRSINGINRGSVTLDVNGERITLESPTLQLIDDTLLIYSPQMPYTHGERIQASLLRISDTLGFESEEIITTEFIIDLQPPYVESFSPSCGIRLNNFPDSIWFRIFEDISPINWENLYLVFDNDTFFGGSSLIDIQGSTIVFRPDRSIFSRAGEHKFMVGGITDSPQLCAPNRMSEFSCSFFVGSHTFLLPETTAFPSETLLIPLNTSGDSAQLDSIKIGISFDSTVCNPLGLEIRDGWSRGNRLTIQKLTPGFLQFSVAGRINLQSGTMCYIVVYVRCDAKAWDFSPLRLEEVLANATYNFDSFDGFLGILYRDKDWLVEIQTVSGENSGTISFGISSRGTNNFDPGLDRIYIPQPPGWLSGYFVINDDRFPFILGLERDIKGHSSEINWQIRIVDGEGELRWDNRRLPDGEFRINGQDMRFCSSVFAREGDEFEISFRVSELARYTGELKAGWNLVSVPFSLARPEEPERIFPTMIGPLFHYTSSTGYDIPRAIEYGKGYFVLSSMNYPITYAGQASTIFRVELNPGWNMIGAPASSIQFEPTLARPSSAILEGMLFGYSSETFSYFVSDSLITGKGYFIFALEPCTITATPSRHRTSLPQRKEIRLDFDNGTKLYLFVEGLKDIPTPPTFKNMKEFSPILKYKGISYLGLSLEGKNDIFLSIDNEAIKLKPNIAPDINLSLDLEGKNYILNLENQRVYTITKGKYKIRFAVGSTGEGIRFEIYPNPVNLELSTVISGIQHEWSLDIVNIVGQSVTKLNGKGEGIYYIDTRRFPTGIYFVRLLTGGASIVKKLVVLR